MVMDNFDRASYVELMECLLSLGDVGPCADHDVTDVQLRHDIDSDLIRAWKMAVLEHSMGIRSTYYILNTASYWDDPMFGDVILALIDMGHEVGWHNNAITEHIKTGLPLRECVNTPLSKLRSYGCSVVGSASHGDGMCRSLGYVNYHIWNECKDNTKWASFSMADFGLKYEAYFLRRDLYISDSGARWHDNGKVIIYPSKLNGLALDGRKLQVLTHPEHWNL